MNHRTQIFILALAALTCSVSASAADDYSPKATAERLRRVAGKYHNGGNPEGERNAEAAAACAEKQTESSKATEVERAFNKGANLPAFCK